MRFLTSDETKEWLSAAGVDESPVERHVVRCALPPAPRFAWFAAWLVTAVPARGERLFWVTETGIWPSSENWSLVAAVRRGFGEKRPISLAPATVGGSDEIDELAALVVLAFVSGWDAVIFGRGNSVHIKISHDEWIEISAESAAIAEQISSELRVCDVQLLYPRAV